MTGAGDAAGWLDGLEERARLALPAEVYRYVAQGARDGVTAAEASWAWRGHRLHPHVLRDTTHVDLATAPLGRRSELPWGVAPMTLQRAAHADGELAMARAGAEAGSVMVVSSNAGTTFEEIADTGVRWWLQVYLPADRTLAVPLLRRAVAAGAEAVVLTVDTPVVAAKYGADRADVERRAPGLIGVNHADADAVVDPDRPPPPGADKALDLGPRDLDWLAETTGLPVVVKGVLRPDDARRCVQAGVAAVWVSNHGGRQLDRAVATASALPAVVTAVERRAEVYVDGGLRSGLDVVTALGLGADHVFVGRPALWALVEGEAGVSRLHRELAAQTHEALRLAGCGRPADARGLAAPAGLEGLGTTTGPRS